MRTLSHQGAAQKQLRAIVVKVTTTELGFESYVTHFGLISTQPQDDATKPNLGLPPFYKPDLYKTATAPIFSLALGKKVYYFTN